MPNCFSLTRKGEKTPTDFIIVDEELCAMLGVPVHPTAWVEHWYNIIGLSLACGKSLEELTKQYKEEKAERLVKIAEYLGENYVTNAWCER